MGHADELVSNLRKERDDEEECEPDKGSDFEYRPTITYRHLLSTSFEPSNPLRVIAHCDVDAAYAQFEAKRVGLDCQSVPVVVMQWNKLIAVNYVARAFNVNRFNCTLDEAKRRCPNLRLIHVATIGPGEMMPQYHPNPDARTHKVSLDLYRRESKKIMELFRSKLSQDRDSGKYVDYTLQPIVPCGWAPCILDILPNSREKYIPFEKASIDESFFDLSVHVRKQILLRYPFLDIRPTLEMMDQERVSEKLDEPLPEVPLYLHEDMMPASWLNAGAWLPDTLDRSRPLELTWLDIAHAIAAEHMISIRKHVYEQLGYTTYV